VQLHHCTLSFLLARCRELFRKGLIADAMKEVKKGNEKGYVTSPDLAKHVIEQLALAGLRVRGLRVRLESLQPRG